MIYIYTHIFTYLHICTHTHTYIAAEDAYSSDCVDEYKSNHVHTYTYIYIYIHTHTNIPITAIVWWKSTQVSVTPAK